jgi:1-acyl-sn-glycerol-3-phosphate acyltransferase
MTGGALSMHYPRRTLQRSVLRMLGRVLLRVRVTGTGRFPAQGRLLVVGNHVGAVEVPLMIAYGPQQIEMLGPRVIPPPPALDAIARLYGYTAIHRANVDRLPLVRMLDVLRQRGVVGRFAEGGIWDPGTKPTKRGVAWLSHRAQAPILPVGFGSLEGALNAASRLQRPKVSMHVGERTLHYVRHANPGFFTYRFGHQEGRAMAAGLSELQDLATR